MASNNNVPVIENFRGNSDLHEALKEKMRTIESREEEFQHYDWGGVRPPDITLFDRWRTRLHPSNKFSSEGIDWHEVHSELSKFSS